MYNLDRFLDAQVCYYDLALQEIKDGCKRSHWMWYIFPQIIGLGDSWKSEKFSIVNLEEEIVYIQHPILGPRLIEASEAILSHSPDVCTAFLGYPDNLKLRSCMTLFEIACPEQTVFQKVIDKFYDGQRDELTLQILGRE